MTRLLRLLHGRDVSRIEREVGAIALHLCVRGFANHDDGDVRTRRGLTRLRER